MSMPPSQEASKVTRNRQSDTTDNTSSIPDSLSWLVIEGGQGPNHSEQNGAVNPALPARELRHAGTLAEATTATVVPAEPRLQQDSSYLAGRTGQCQHGKGIQPALPQEQQGQQAVVKHQAQEPAQHEVVYGPMPRPDSVSGSEHRQQVAAAEQSAQQQAPGNGHMGASVATQQYAYDQAGTPIQAWGQLAYAPQGHVPPPSYPHNTGTYSSAAYGAAYGADSWQWSYAQYSPYGAPPHSPVAAWGFLQPPRQQVVPYVAMVDQYGQQYLPACSMVIPGAQHQVMQGLPPGQPPPPPGPAPAMTSIGSRQNGHVWPNRPPPLAGGPARGGAQGFVPGRGRGQRHGMHGGGRPNGRVMPECININRRITACRTTEELLNIVAQNLEKFDSVCMATSIHTLANLRCTKSVFESSEMMRLMAAVSDKRTDFTARNLANFLWGLAKIEHHPGEQMLVNLAAEVAKKIDGANAQNLANIAWAYAVLMHSPGPELLDTIAREAEKKLTEFTSQNISNLVYAFAKLEHVPSGFLEHASQAAQTLLSQFTPQALSNTVWAFSKLEVLDEELFSAIAREAIEKLPGFNAQNIANTAWGFANILFEPGEEFWQLVGQNAIWHIHDYSAQNIANVVWSYAKLSHKHEALFAAAAEHATRTIHTFQPQSMANLVWAYATLAEKPDVHCLDALASFACRNLQEFSPQNISNSAWAMATLQYKNMQFLSAVADEVTTRLASSSASSFSRQHLANLIWAYATLEVEPKQALLQAVANAMAERASECNPQEISNCVWAFARLSSPDLIQMSAGFYDEKVMDVFANEAQGRIEEFSQQNLANVAWAVGKLSHFHQGLLDAMAKHATSMVKDLSLQHISNILWAYVSLLQMREPMTGAFLEELRLRLHGATFNAQQLSNLLWSLCIAELCTEEIWQGTMEQISKLGIHPAELPEEALTQIYQAHLLMMVDKPGVDLRMPGGLMEAAQRTWLASARNVRVSALHRDVSRLLSEHGVLHTIEHLTDDHLFSVDIALAAERITFEVDGPHHFMANTLAVTGEMLARQKLLRARGWHVISVPFFRWAGRSDGDRAQWLLQELHVARDSQAKTYGLSWAATAPSLAQPAHAPQATYPSWGTQPSPPTSSVGRPEVRAHANPSIPGPAPPPHPPPGQIPATAHRPAVTSAVPVTSASAPAVPLPRIMQPPPSSATVSLPVKKTPAMLIGTDEATQTSRKRLRSPDPANEPAVKRINATDPPDSPSRMGGAHLPSHVLTEVSQDMPSTETPGSQTFVNPSQETGDVTTWQAHLHGSAGSVTQQPTHHDSSTI